MIFSIKLMILKFKSFMYIPFLLYQMLANLISR